MDLKTFLKSLGDEEARSAFASSCETTLGHLRNTIYVPGKVLAAENCVLAERVSGRQVMRWDLRPEDWWRIWPELIGCEGAPAIVEPAAQA